MVVVDEVHKGFIGLVCGHEQSARVRLTTLAEIFTREDRDYFQGSRKNGVLPKTVAFLT